MHVFKNDQEVISALNCGDPVAFEFIYRTHVAELYRYARKNIKVQEDCQEIIQDIFESLWTRHKEVRIITVRHYLLDMVKYKVIRYFQKKSVRKKYAEHFRLFELVYDAYQNDEVSLDADDLRKLIDQSVAKLPERCQVAFRMRLLENLSNTEIARRMNITKGTVENYMVRAVQKIRDSYHANYKPG